MRLTTWLIEMRCPCSDRLKGAINISTQCKGKCTKSVNISTQCKEKCTKSVSTTWDESGIVNSDIYITSALLSTLQAILMWLWLLLTDCFGCLLGSTRLNRHHLAPPRPSCPSPRPCSTRATSLEAHHRCRCGRQRAEAWHRVWMSRPAARSCLTAATSLLLDLPIPPSALWR